ncbi:MAG: hypothetical protein PHV37_03405 [Candidatus Gastranaerophilales bacterium]|nr:hypothetical protein [Candidatus Gastranaerophilales bacterium]
MKIDASNLINTLPKKMKPVATFIKMQEGGSGLSNSRFIQDTATNLLPKAVFARSVADLSETSFLEVAESLLVYYCPTILGEKVFRKSYTKGLTKPLQNMISKPASEIIKNAKLSKTDQNSLITKKAAISLSALAIPLAEYSLNYIKNLFTLKVFNKADFNNIANLNKDQTEENAKQQKVKKSAYNHLKLAAGIFAGALGASALLAKKGANSKILQKVSETILVPGDKIFKNNAKKAKTFNKYFSLDFADNAGKLGLSHGQLTACVIGGGFGYFGAAKDRGKQNFLEVLFRYPLVGFYVITGSELFEKGFKGILKKAGKCKDVIGKNLEVPSLKELPELAEKLAKQNGSAIESEYKNIFKQKALISTAPFVFSMGFMGLFVAGCSRFFTQLRYNKDKKAQENVKAANQFNNNSIEDFQNKITTK